jgi:uncharacterized protein (DUF1015 family)
MLAHGLHADRAPSVGDGVPRVPTLAAVPRFEPFRALRYPTSADLDAVVAPPYDVLSASDVDALAARDPHNIVRIDVPRETDGAGRYDAAAATLRSWVESGALVADRDPSFTLYRMSFSDEVGQARETVGVIGALEVVDVGSPEVLPHERTTPKASTDRLELTRATGANLSPVWGLSLTAGLSDVLAAPGELLGEVHAEGVTHRVERVSDPARVEAISRTVSATPVLIADGHHRYSIARTYRDEQRAARDGDAGGAELTMTYVGELVAEQLSVAAIHRIYRGVDAASLLGRLGDWFVTEPAGPVDAQFATETVARSALCFVDAEGNGTWLTPRPDRFTGVRNLDGALLEHALDGFAHEVDYQHGVEETVHRVTSGEVAAAVLIRPVSVEEIRRTATEGLLMPPKSTFFTPKLRTGLVIRPLGDAG